MFYMLTIKNNDFTFPFFLFRVQTVQLLNQTEIEAEKKEEENNSNLIKLFSFKLHSQCTFAASDEPN